MLQQNLKIGWVGFHQEGIPALLGLKESGHRLEAVITLQDDALSRRSAAASYATVLEGWDVPLHAVQNINDASAVELLQGLDLDLLFVIGWSQILNSQTLSTARVGVIGAHASLLPHNRGSAPINWALIYGQTKTGNTLIWLTEDVDNGEIVDQMEFPVTPYDTCETLYDKVADSNHTMIQRLLPRLFAGEKPGRPQPATDQPLLPRRRPADGLMNWNQSAGDVYNFVRALTRPYPGAFSFLNGRRWIIQSCQLLPAMPETRQTETLPSPLSPSATHASPGQILGLAFSPVQEACGVVVQCDGAQIVILEIEDLDGTRLSGQALTEHAITNNWTGNVWANE